MDISLVVFHDLIYKVDCRVDVLHPGTQHERDACFRKQTPDLFERRYGHYGIADPVRGAHEDPSDLFRREVSHSAPSSMLRIICSKSADCSSRVDWRATKSGRSGA